MRRPLLRAVERSCDRRVRGASTSRRGGLVDRRGDEWMGEADSLAVDDHDPSCRRLHQGSFEILVPVRREQDVDRGAGQGCRPEEDVACAGAELRDTPADCVGGGGWDRNQRCRVVGEPVLGEQCRDFLAEQRISVARRVELPQNRPGKAIAATHDGLKRIRVERSYLDGGEVAVRRRDVDLRPVSRSKPGREPNLLGLDAPERELERAQ